MNIFATSECPAESAKALDDKRVVKMVLESCQSLNTVLIKLRQQGIGYKPIHQNHPCVLWAEVRKPTWYRQDCNPNEWSMV